jgi:hypothetical protein
VLVLYAEQPAEPLGTLYSFLINAAVFYNFRQCIRYLTKKTRNIFVLILGILIAAFAIIAITVFFKILGDAIILNVSFHESRSKAFFMKAIIESSVAPYKVVSLVLMMLIENMFKHGIFNQNTKKAALSITIEDRKLHFYSLNYKSNIIINKAQSNGIGLNYIRERLTDEYGREGYELLINETHNTYECKLIMPLKYSENHAGLILKGDRNLLINQKPIYV